MKPALLAALILTLHTPWLAAQSPIKPTHPNVPYGQHPSQVLDVYLATSDKPTPLLFFIHGGGWMNGDKANPDFLDRFLKDGMSVVSINYRLIPQAQEQGVKPPVKACLEDCARALQFVRSKSTEWNIDKTRIAGCGGSAGGYNTLWLAFHDDMADPKSDDPIARESTRLVCAMTFVPQTSLDPTQMRDWIPNNDYGHHAFLLPSYQSFIDQREQLMDDIRKYSPYELVTSDDPPVYLFYDTPLAMGQPAADPPHSANFGGGLVVKLKEKKVPYIFNYKGATDIPEPDLFRYLTTHLQAKK
jgi:acetyl esterase/lipase